MAKPRTRPRPSTDTRARDEAREARQRAEEDELDGVGANPDDLFGGGNPVRVIPVWTTRPTPRGRI